MPVKTIDQTLEPVGDETITGLSVVKTLTTPGDALYVWLQAQDQDVRLRDSGSDPSASEGMLIVAGAAPIFYSGKLSAVKLIETAVGASVFVSYYKPATAAYGVV